MLNEQEFCHAAEAALDVQMRHLMVREAEERSLALSERGLIYSNMGM
jgi:hypothetical protein